MPLTPKLKPISWGVLQLCGINRWMLMMMATAVTLCILLSTVWKDAAPLWLNAVVLFITGVCVLWTGLAVALVCFLMLRLSVIRDDAEVLPNLLDLISDSLRERREARNFRTRQQVSLQFVRELAALHLNWLLFGLLFSVFAMLAGTIYLMLTTDFFIENRAPESKLIEPNTRYVGDPLYWDYFLGKQTHGYGDPPQKNRLTLEDYTKVMLLLPLDATEARQVLQQKAERLTVTPGEEYRARYIVFRMADVDELRKHLPQDSPAIAYLESLVAPSGSQVVINAEDLVSLRRVVPKELHFLTDFKPDENGRVAVDRWEANAIRVLQDHFQKEGGTNE